MRAELAAVVSSKYLSRAPTLIKFLTYVCEKYFQGEADQIKEYTIAVEAFGRPDTFEPKRDPIVRVDANRLRVRLRKYYRNEGRDHKVKIWLPTGQYVPVFEFCDQEPTGEQAAEQIVETASGPSCPLLPSLPSDSSTPADRPPAIHPAVKLDRSGERIPAPVYSLAGIMSIILALALLGIRWSAPTTSQADPAPLAGFSESIGGNEVRILCGNMIDRYTDQVGRTWTGDRYFFGGRPFSIPGPIARAEDPVIWQNGREGEFEYHIPLAPGIYELHLYFAKPLEREGGGETARLFDLFVNGEPALEVFDVIADAGGARTADVKILTDIRPAADGLVHLSLKARTSTAILNAIEIVPGIPGRMRPIQITTDTRPRYSKDRSVWFPDRYVSGGRRVSRTEHVIGSDSPEIYASERFGNFSYFIPVAPGRYTVRLHFREAYFGLHNPGMGGAGSRIFDVYCNGVALLKDFDIFAEAGGADRALVKEFTGLEANAQGKLILNFQPIKNYALINALEIIQEPAS